MTTVNEIKITIFVDGDTPIFLNKMIDWWCAEWNSRFYDLGTLTFERILDVKRKEGFDSLPLHLKPAFLVRNPDIFFVATIGLQELVLGGIEITTHSPDGSNVEKRYPFIWSGRTYGFNSFIVCPYMKIRANGQHNRLPNRHSMRNIEFANEWLSGKRTFHQIIPVQELQPSFDIAESFLSHELFDFRKITNFFCSYLAHSVGDKGAIADLNEFVYEAKSLAEACAAVTKYTNPSSLFEGDNRTIQIYNTRPDSGHWERGEGQFDSIDGRLMFTLDGMSHNSEKKLEFWMPQLSKAHPWVTEQVNRGYGSKRFRNINVLLSNKVEVKYLEDLTPDDINILKNNQSLTLERMDWNIDIYNVKELINGGNLDHISKIGLKNKRKDIIDDIYATLNHDDLYLSTHRIYKNNWEFDFVDKINVLPVNSVLLVPRLNRDHLSNFILRRDITIYFAEDCTKIQLLALRQLHRYCF